MQAHAVVLERPGQIVLEDVELDDPSAGDIVVEVEWSSISTGTERLLWEGRMPQFPGMGYPLVPGYETVGVVADAGPEARHMIGTRVFVPGARCYRDVKPLFGGAASTLVVPANRTLPLPAGLAEDGSLLALAATAWRAVQRAPKVHPQIIVGHGVLGRLAARIVLALGGEPPLVLESNPTRRDGNAGYPVDAPEAVPAELRAKTILDASGDPHVIDRVMPHLAKGGEIVLAGFYAEPVAFAFPPAFMKEASVRISAEFEPADVEAVCRLIEAGRLTLSGLITHQQPVARAADAYRTAFGDAECLKMVLDWRSRQ